jgi:hypothetical protein
MAFYDRQQAAAVSLCAAQAVPQGLDEQFRVRHDENPFKGCDADGDGLALSLKFSYPTVDDIE